MDRNLEVIVIAGGAGSRFKFDTPKHLVRVAGSSLVLGTANKIRQYTENLKIIIPPDKEIYKQVLDHSFQLLLRRGDVTKGTGKHLEAINNSSDNNNLLIVYGDTYFSQKALDIIFQQASTTNEKIIFFCRYNSQAFVNKGGGEIFSIYISHAYKRHFVQAANKTQELYDSKKIWRDGTWEIAKTLKGLSTENEYREHPNYDFYYEINDSTDDIDFVEEYDHLVRLFPNSLEETTLLLEAIYESINNIVQKNNINIHKYESNLQNNALNSKLRNFNLGEIIEFEFEDLRKEISALYLSKSFRYTLPLRKTYSLYNRVMNVLFPKIRHRGEIDKESKTTKTA